MEMNIKYNIHLYDLCQHIFVINILIIWVEQINFFVTTRNMVIISSTSTYNIFTKNKPECHHVDGWKTNKT